MHVRMYMYVCMYACILYVCMHACMYVVCFVCMYVCMYVCMHSRTLASMYGVCMCIALCMYTYTHVCYADKPVVQIATVSGGCGYVNISWNVTGNNDECRVTLYDVTLSYVTMDDHIIESMLTAMNSYTFTLLPDDTQVNITVFGILTNRDIVSFDSTSVKTMEFESAYVQIYKLLAFE